MNIEGLCAHTPQAKGRVERAHLTLQDRLLIEPGPQTLPLPGRLCRVYEPEEGPIEIRYQGELLPYGTLFDKKPHVRQAAIVENKRLAAVLTQIREGQRARDQQRLAGHRVSQREKERIRKAQERADTL